MLLQAKQNDDVCHKEGTAMQLLEHFFIRADFSFDRGNHDAAKRLQYGF